MSMQWIRDTYRVAAKRGARITFTCCATCGPRQGTIVGSTGPLLRVQMDDSDRSISIHPNWNVEYGDAS